MRKPLRKAAIVLAMLAWAPGAHAKNLFGMTDTAVESATRRFGPEDVMRGWDGFSDGWFMLDMATVLALAVLLGAVIAYHPSSRAKASSVKELEQPKTFIMYSMVGAMIALAVQANPALGLVVFGLGGLLRFRTNVGAAKDTGRVILTTIVGVCCGMKLLVPAVFATAAGWILIWYLESQNIARMQIQGIARESLPRAAEAYRALLVQSGFKILGEKKKLVKGQISFVIKSARPIDREALEDQCASAVPEGLRGSIDWDLA